MLTAQLQSVLLQPIVFEFQGDGQQNLGLFVRPVYLIKHFHNIPLWLVFLHMNRRMLKTT